ncbi:hypothetical protein BC830DRAFT_1172212 [Chytriomyces sp. MP71]|nr:hypothetical protein BC830DRAFT_1172212 [Chytriomyces sp. MP71]
MQGITLATFLASIPACYAAACAKSCDDNGNPIPGSVVTNVARTALSQPVRTVVENGTPVVINSNLNTLQLYSLPTGKRVDIGGLMYNYDAASGYIKQGNSCLNTTLAVSECGVPECTGKIGRL